MNEQILKLVKDATLAVVQGNAVIPAEVDAYVAASNALETAVTDLTDYLDDVSEEVFVDLATAITTNYLDANPADRVALVDSFKVKFDMKDDVAEGLVEDLFAAQEDFVIAAQDLVDFLTPPTPEEPA